MASLRTVIADDEPPARRRLRSVLAAHPDFEVVAECCNGLEAVEAVEAHRPDVLFLDVQMPGIDGIQVLESLPEGAVGAVVLVTAYDEYAVAAFEHHALDYVLKPLDPVRMERTAARVRARLAERSAAALGTDALHRLAAAYRAGSGPGGARPVRRILLRSAQKISVLPVEEIDWIEADGYHVRLHAGARTHLHRASLATLEQQLDPDEFVRIHRSTIVRVARVREMEPYFHGEYTVVLADGTRLKLSRTYRAKLQAALGEEL